MSARISDREIGTGSARAWLDVTAQSSVWWAPTTGIRTISSGCRTRCTVASATGSAPESRATEDSRVRSSRRSPSTAARRSRATARTPLAPRLAAGPACRSGSATGTPLGGARLGSPSERCRNNSARPSCFWRAGSRLAYRLGSARILALLRRPKPPPAPAGPPANTPAAVPRGRGRAGARYAAAARRPRPRSSARFRCRLSRIASASRLCRRPPPVTGSIVGVWERCLGLGGVRSDRPPGSGSRVGAPGSKTASASTYRASSVSMRPYWIRR